MSDREKVGLRGLVQQFTEERTTPAFENFSGTSYVSISKYSPEGKLLQTSIGNSVESAQESSINRRRARCHGLFRSAFQDADEKNGAVVFLGAEGRDGGDQGVENF
jgi:hypothetical protein